MNDIPNMAVAAAKDHPAKDGNGIFGFGVDDGQCAAALRNLADRLDAGTAIAQEMSDATHATAGDFTLRTLTFKFAVRHEAD